MIPPVPIERLTPERRRELTRAALIDAAAELFAEKGFHATSLEEIAESAGFTRGAIYSNFKDKEELLLAVLERHILLQQQKFSELQEGVDASSPPKEMLDASTRLWTEEVARNRMLLLLTLELRLYAMRNPVFRKRLAELSIRLWQGVTEILIAISEREGLKPIMPPEDFAVFTTAFSEGIQQFAAIDEENSSRYHRIAASVFEFMHTRMFEPKDPPKRKR